MAKITQHRDAPYWTHSQPDDQEEVTPETIEASIARIAAELEDACPGQIQRDGDGCNQRWRTAQRRAVAELDRAIHAPAPECVPALHLVRPRPYNAGAPVWCRACTAEILSGVGRLPELAAAAGARRDGQLAPPPQSERHAAAVAPPSPSPAWDQVDQIVSWTALQADRLARHLHEPDPALYRRTGFPAPTLTRTVAYLLHRKTALMAAPFARDFGRELLDLVARSEKVASVDELVHHLPDACFACGRKKLERRDGHDRVVCRACHRSWPESMFAYLAKHATEEASS